MQDKCEDRRRLCLEDSDGYFIANQFHTRELGYYAYNGDHGRLAFEPDIPNKNLFIRDRRTVNFVNKKLLGLPYHPYPAEQAMQQVELESTIQRLYYQFSSAKRPLFGYKGGHVEKNILNKLNIPHFN